MPRWLGWRLVVLLVSPPPPGASDSPTPHYTAPHCTAPAQHPPSTITPPPPPSHLALQMRPVFQPYVEPASVERANSPHVQLQTFEDTACMTSELWEEKDNPRLQPLPAPPSDTARAATSDTLRRAQGELSQHWLSLSSQHPELLRERHDEPHDFALGRDKSSLVPGRARGVREVGVAKVGAVQKRELELPVISPFAAVVPSDRPLDTERSVIRM